MSRTKIEVRDPQIAERIKALRQYLGLSLKSFGEKIGYSPSQISRLETGETNPSETILGLICMAYGVREGYFEGEVPLQEAVETPHTTEEIRRGVAERLKNLRSEEGINRSELGRRVGISTQNICCIERGERELSRNYAEKIADYFSVGVEWLLTGDTKKKEFPVSDKLVEWLWANPAVRKELWERMGQEVLKPFT